VVTVVTAGLSGTVDDYGDDEKYVIKLGFKELADCFDKCDVGIEITPGSVVVTATIIDTSDEAEPPDASIFTSDTIATELAAVAEAEGIESLMEVGVEYVAEPVTTYTTVTTVVSAIPPSPPPSPSPVASPPSDDEPPFVSFLESLGVPAPIVDVLVAIFTLITDLFAGLFD
jgi:hypothetical protein